MEIRNTVQLLIGILLKVIQHAPYKKKYLLPASETEVRFARSNRGKSLLILNGKAFTLNRRTKDTSYWECVKTRCKHTKCSARIVSKAGHIASMRGQHNHD